MLLVNYARKYSKPKSLKALRLQALMRKQDVVYPETKRKPNILESDIDTKERDVGNPTESKEPLEIKNIELLQQHIFTCAVELEYCKTPINEIIERLHMLADAKIKEM